MRLNRAMYHILNFIQMQIFDHMLKTELHKTHVNCGIISYGNVSVKAGVFKAYKIYEQMNFEKIMASSYYWYAPDVGIIVKCIPRSLLPMVSDIELISYTSNQ